MKNSRSKYTQDDRDDTNEYLQGLKNLRTTDIDENILDTVEDKAKRQEKPTTVAPVK